MPPKQATPGEGGGQRIDHFSYWFSPPDKPWTGWLAGPPWWIYGHTGKSPTKVCVKWLTDGGVSCVRCGGKKPAEMVGYVPVYRESDGAPILVIVYDNSYDFLKDAEYPAYLRIVREGGEQERAIVQQMPSKKKYVTSLTRRHKPADITEQVVKLWGMAEVSEWYQMRHPGAKVTPEAKAVEMPSEAARRIVAGEAGSLFGLAQVALGDQVNEIEALRRRQEAYQKGKDAARNGYHRPKS